MKDSKEPDFQHIFPANLDRFKNRPGWITDHCEKRLVYHVDFKPENLIFFTMGHHARWRREPDVTAKLIVDGDQPPPPCAEFLLALMATKRTRDALLGDYEEEFHANCQKAGGVKRARRIYWAGVLRSILPLIWGKARSLGLFGMVLTAFKYFSR